MHDRDIRQALVAELECEYLTSPDTLLVHELGVCSGAARVDVAVINSHLGGFEIKSASDTLVRLEAQVSAYQRVFDELTIVTEAEHLPRVESLVPEWVGLFLVSTATTDGCISRVRVPKVNDSQDPLAIAQLLWRDEAIDVLAASGHDHGVRSRPRRYAWERLASCLPIAELKAQVLGRLKSRVDWRPDAKRRQGDATFRPSAM